MNSGRLIGFAATMLIAMSAGPAFAQATVKVGVLLNLTGQLQTIGVQALAGMRLPLFTRLGLPSSRKWHE